MVVGMGQLQHEEGQGRLGFFNLEEGAQKLYKITR